MFSTYTQVVHIKNRFFAFSTGLYCVEVYSYPQYIPSFPLFLWITCGKVTFFVEKSVDNVDNYVEKVDKNVEKHISPCGYVDNFCGKLIKKPVDMLINFVENLCG